MEMEMEKEAELPNGNQCVALSVWNLSRIRPMFGCHPSDIRFAIAIARPRTLRTFLAN